MMQLTDTSYLRRFLYRLNHEQRTGIKRHHSLKRLLNFFLIRLQLAIRAPYILGYPYFLVVESTNLCNLSCPLCPTGQRIKGREKGKISLDNFKKIIDELGDYLYFVRLENWGEPLLNESIFDIVEYANKRKINTSFNTNFSFLNGETAARLIDSGLSHIKISLDGTSQDSYARYRVGGDFNQVVGNIRRLIEARNNLKRKNPLVEIQFIVMKHNEGEVNRIQELCFDLGVDNLFIENLRLDMREELFVPDSFSIDKYKDWLPVDNKYSLFDYKAKTRKAGAKICGWLWTSSVINWDGSVAPCCGVYDPHYDFGNIFKDGFRNIWNGEKYIAARKLIGHKKKSNIETICTNCFKYRIIA